MVKELTAVKLEDLCFLLQALHRFPVRRERQANILLQFVAQLQSLRVSQVGEFEDKATALVRMVVVTAGEMPSASGNLALVLEDFLVSKRDVESFCNVHWKYLLELTGEALLKVFRELTRAGVGANTLALITSVSRLLANEEEFYKLRLLYEQLVLGDLARRGKCCNRAGVAAALFDLCELYVIGFLTHCNIGRSGIDCLLFNVHLLSEVDQKKWVQLAFFAAERPALAPYVISSLEPHIPADRLQRWDTLKTLSRREVWEITTRSIRKHKVYKTHPSNLKGIVNKSSRNSTTMQSATSSPLFRPSTTPRPCPGYSLAAPVSPESLPTSTTSSRLSPLLQPPSPTWKPSNAMVLPSSMPVIPRKTPNSTCWR